MENTLQKTAAAVVLACSALAAGVVTATPRTGPGNAEEQRQDSVRYAVTTLSANYLREQPDFTAELGNQLLMGTPVEILDEEGYWRKVRSPDPYTAWCVDLGVHEMSREEISKYIAAEKVICIADYSKVLEKPSGKSRKICDIVSGDLLLLRKKRAGKYLEAALPSGETGYVRKRDVAIFREWAESREATPENIIATAMDFIGVPYLWGGTSIKGADCSGFTRMVWFLNGVLLPRNASQQAGIGQPVEMSADTVKFPADKAAVYADDPLFRQEMLRRTENLRTGDLIFFGKGRISHVGIYLGEGKFIHSSRYVRISSLIPGDPDFHEISGSLVRARRIIGQEGSPGLARIIGSPAYFPQRQ